MAIKRPGYFLIFLLCDYSMTGKKNHGEVGRNPIDVRVGGWGGEGANRQITLSKLSSDHLQGSPGVKLTSTAHSATPHPPTLSHPRYPRVTEFLRQSSPVDFLKKFNNQLFEDPPSVVVNRWLFQSLRHRLRGSE